MKKRTFLKQLGLGSLGLLVPKFINFQSGEVKTPKHSGPLFISTWSHGLPANKAALEKVRIGGSILDACEAGVKRIEGDPDYRSVGLGGRPDRDGVVTLDACVMNEKGECGSVCALEGIIHAVSVARKVMEETPHVILAGDGAKQFAIQQGFKEADLLTETSKNEWIKWLKESKYQPVINIENHDTIGLLGMDKNRNLSGVCTTSGLAYKVHGRVGDSPVIGAGLYVDNAHGAAVATGIGEYVLKCLSSFEVVSYLKNGLSPMEATKKAIQSIAYKIPEHKKGQVGLIALAKTGEYAAYSIHPGFSYAVNIDGEEILEEAKSLYSK